MGHIRLGRIPKTRHWNAIFNLLGDDKSNTDDIANSVLKAAGNFLINLKNDPGLYYTYWLLTKITWEARSDQFHKNLSKIDLMLDDENNVFGFISKLTENINKKINNDQNKSLFSEMAKQSLSEVLTNLVSEKTNTLFDTTSEDLRLACKSYSTQNQFSKLSRLYFSTFLNRYIQFFLSKEISNYIGEGKKFKNINNVVEFDEAIKTFCFQSSKIVEDFAGGWYSKRNWQGNISEQDAKNFIGIALKKIRDEVKMEDLQQ